MWSEIACQKIRKTSSTTALIFHQILENTQKRKSESEKSCNWVSLPPLHVKMENLIGLQNEESIKQYQTWEMDEEIQIFREYLRYPTVHPNIDYGKKFPGS